MKIAMYRGHREKSVKQSGSWLRSPKVKKACGQRRWKDAGYKRFINCAAAVKSGTASSAASSAGKSRLEQLLELKAKGCITEHQKGCRDFNAAELAVLKARSTERRTYQARDDSKFFNPETMPLRGHRRLHR